MSLTNMKKVVGLTGILAVVSLTACSNQPEAPESAAQNVQTDQESAEADQETVTDDLSKQQGEISQPETMAIESGSQDKAIELYVNVLQNYLSEGKTDFAVSFIDLDDDSTREMVVFFGESQADGGYLFTIKNGEAVQVVAEGSDFFGQYGGFAYKEKGNIFVAENESVTESQTSTQVFYYAMENGKAVCKDVTQSITQFDSDESRFYVNDLEVDSEELNRIAEKYGLSEMSAVGYSDGVRVRNEQMDMVYNAYHKDEGHSATGKEDTLESLVGEYDYVSDNGTGRLTIQKTSHGYDISDYDSESSYRFLADSSNIENMEEDRIYIKYPEQVFSDGEAVFGYYILEYDADGIDVYYGKSAFEEAEFLYHAAKKAENADSERTADELLDLFIDGSISAANSEDPASAFYITDLNMDTGEWDSYSVGEKADLDNDGENELIICGPYGGIYFDARDNKVYEFAAGEGNALSLSYVYYNGAVWILYSNSMNAGYEAYHMEKYEGADNLAAEINFGEELTDPDNAESETKYTLNGAVVSYDEYSEFCSKIFATEVSTN